MKSLIVYYSYTGNTREEALALAAQQEADLVEVLDAKRPGMVGAFLQCISARGMRCTPIVPLGIDFTAYGHITIMAPVWAGFPAPAINHVLNALPRGLPVSVHLISGSGQSACREQVTAKILSMGCTVDQWVDVKK